MLQNHKENIMKDFSGKVAVITGAASGVGRAIALNLAKEGAKIIISDIEQSKLNIVLDELLSIGCNAVAFCADVSSDESMSKLAHDSQEVFGVIHLFFANAGIGTGEAGNMWDFDLNDWRWGFNVNTWGVIHSIKSFMPILINQNIESHFIITGSGNGAFLMMPNTPIYTASKAAVQAITENLYY